MLNKINTAPNWLVISYGPTLDSYPLLLWPRLGHSSPRAPR